MAGTGYQRKCSECPTLLARGSKAITCSPKCRGARSRRIRRSQKQNGERLAAARYEAESDGIRAVREVVNDVPDIGTEVAKEELRPIVREAITEEVLSSISQMVGLAPVAIEQLSRDMESDDSKVRQTAYSLWFKYTVGNKSVADAESGPPQMIVHFDMPRPGDATTEDVPSEPIEDASEVKECDMCGEEKPVNQFVANSDRCGDCLAKAQERAAHLLAGTQDEVS